MKFLLVEILIWLIAASILGLIFGWLFKALFASRKLAAANSEWSTKFNALKISSDEEIASLEESVKSLESDNGTLQSKVGSLSAMVKSMESALLKANAENKTLSSTVSSQQMTINEIRVESENLIKKQSALQLELNEMEKAKEQEFEALKRQLGDNGVPDSSTQAPDATAQDEHPASGQDDDTATDGAVSRLAPVLDTPEETDAGDIDQKIKNLNEQRDRLNREREELFQQEQLFSAQLTRGDDTEAYLDQTIRIDEDLTTTIQSDTSELHRAAATPANSASIGNADSDAQSSTAPLSGQPEKPKSLWDKFKSSVNKPADKPKA